MFNYYLSHMKYLLTILMTTALFIVNAQMQVSNNGQSYDARIEKLENNQYYIVTDTREAGAQIHTGAVLIGVSVLPMAVGGIMLAYGIQRSPSNILAIGGYVFCAGALTMQFTGIAKISKGGKVLRDL